MNKTRKAVIVSEDRSVLQIFSEFAEINQDFFVLEFRSPDEALRAFSGDAEIAVADIKLSGISGLDFLTAVKEKYPAASKILLAGENDEVDSFKAVNEAGISYIFKKPLQIETLQEWFDEKYFNSPDIIRRDARRVLARVLRAVFHHIKAPLTIIRADADMLTWDDIEDAKRRDLIQSAMNQSDRISDFIDETGSFVKSKWHPSLNLQKMSSDEMMSRMITPFVKSAQEKGIHISSENKSAGYVMMDIDMMRRVLDNLLANSIEAGGRDIEVFLELENNQDNLLLEFRDNGPGIPVGLQKSIFEPFVSVGERNRLGLGLTVCRGIARGHGGDIEFSSVPEGGASFMIKLPLCRS